MESGKADQANYSMSAGEIWQLSLIHDTYWNQNVYIPRGEAGRGKLTFFRAEDLTQAAGRRPVQRQQVQHLRVLPTQQTISFRKTGGSSLHLVKLEYLCFLQPSGEEKMLLF